MASPVTTAATGYGATPLLRLHHAPDLSFKPRGLFGDVPQKEVATTAPQGTPLLQSPTFKVGEPSTLHTVSPAISVATTVAQNTTTTTTSTASLLFGASTPNFSWGVDKNQFKDITQVQINQAIARAIYVTRAPLSLLDHPLWKKVLYLLNPSFSQPSSKDLGNVLLDLEYISLHNSLTQKVKEANVVHLAIDGWSNQHDESILNVVLYAPHPCLHKSIQTKNTRLTPNYIVEEISKIMEEYGADKFLGVVTGKTANIVDCGRLLNQKYNNILWFGCPVYILHLLIGDIIKIPKIRELLAYIVTVIKIVTQSDILNTKFRAKTESNWENMSLHLPVKKRSCSYLQSLERFLKAKFILQSMFNNTEHKPLLKHKTRLLNDTTWDELEKLENIMKPIVKWITTLESNDSTVHLVHKAIIEVDDVLGHSNTIEFLGDDLNDLVTKFRDRKVNILKAVHFAATILDPLSQGAQLTPEENIDGCEVILNMIELSNKEPLLEELSNYKCRRGIWSKDFVWEMAKTVDPLSWWKSLFPKTQLGKIAGKILSIPATSAAVENVSANLSDIPIKKRNKRSDKISFISLTWNMKHRKTSDKIIAFNSCNEETDADNWDSASEDEFSDMSDNKESQS